MRPILLRHATLEMRRHVVNMPLELAVQRRTESTPIRPPLPHGLHDHLSMRARLAAVSRLMVLVEGVGAPEALVTAIAGILARAVVELFLVSLPIEFALECLIARRAPELGIARGIRRGRNGAAHGGRREAAVAARTTRYRGDRRSVLGRRPERGAEVLIAEVLHGRGCWFNVVNARAMAINGHGKARTILCHGCHVLLLLLLLRLRLLLWL